HDGEIGGGHPVNKIPFQHRGVASDDPALFVGGKLFSVWARRYEVMDGSVYVFLERRRVRPLGSHKTERFWGHRSLAPWEVVSPARHVTHRTRRGPTEHISCRFPDCREIRGLARPGYDWN